MLVVVVADQLRQPLVDGDPGPAQPRHQDRHRLGPELLERSVPVVPHVEVDLGDGVEAEVGDEIDQQPDLDAPALDERHRLEQRPPAGVLTRQRLHEPREVWEQRRDHRTGHELGDPATTRRLAVQRAAVVALHEADRGIGEQRLQQPGDEVGTEVPDVGVEPADDVAAAGVQGLPQRVALARAGRQLGQDLGDGEDGGALPGGHLGGGVGRPVVDDHHLVDERGVLDQVAADRRHDLADGRLLVARRQADRDGEVGGPLGRGEGVGFGLDRASHAVQGRPSDRAPKRPPSVVHDRKCCATGRGPVLPSSPNAFIQSG